ncbi:MAG TPA: hypothetical protein VIE69_08605 [Methylophilaceae bacterium]|jgi:hypothetical protein
MEPKSFRAKYGWFGIILFIGAKLLVGINPHHTGEYFNPDALKHSKALKIDLSAAVKNNDWQRVQALYKECKRLTNENGDGHPLWQPDNCEPILLLQESITAKARNVYHGLANDPKYNLSSNWRLHEGQYFPEQESSKSNS